MEICSIEQVLRKLADSGKKYLEFIRVPALSVGIYRLAAGPRMSSGRIRRMRFIM
jgi:hypothetical protein